MTMTDRTIALAQVNPTVGAFHDNVDAIVEFAGRAVDRGADTVVFPELAVCGYPPYDLLERDSFVQANVDALDTITARLPSELRAFVGYVEPNDSGRGKPVFNAAACISDGTVVSKHFKALLPTYDVFREDRYFEPGGSPTLTGPDNQTGVTICEDIWNDPDVRELPDQPRYQRNPHQEVLDLDPQLIVNLSASPFERGKDRYRMDMYSHLAERSGVPLAVCNQVGGNDSLIFDGNSVIFDGNGDVIAQADTFAEDLVVAEVGGDETQQTTSVSLPTEPEAVYRALTLGLKDYFDKCGFDDALVGLSGGVDSSLTATLAVDALGVDHVLGVMMPSEISSEESVTDAEKLANNLGIETRLFPIQELFDGYLDLFSEEFAGLEWDTTEENLQARIRGNILMALSNKYGHILLSTGNKSELAVGYCTLYGDMNGGLAVLSDVPKTMVYELSRYRNEVDRVIPENVLTKPPSAELSPDQKDQDTLPSYEVLDEIIQRYVEEKESREQMKEVGLDSGTVDKVVRMIDLNEFKRQQSPPGLKVTSKAFSVGRDMPIAQQFES